MSDFVAEQFANAFIDAYLRGLRDLRNTSLAPYYAETPRSVPNSEDIQERYSEITGALSTDDSDAAFLTDPPFLDDSSAMPATEFVDLFVSTSGSNNFIKFVTRQGLELNFVTDVEEDEADELALRGAKQIDLAIQQESRGNTITPQYIQEILERSNLDELQFVSTLHFREDEYRNDGFDADSKAGERVRQMTQYIPDLVGELS